MRYLIWDTNLGVEHAARIKKDGHQVKYFTFWAYEGFPHFRSYVPGKGIVDKSAYFFEDLDWADIVMFPDIGVGDLVDYLRRNSGKPVWGAGRGEVLETQRGLACEIMDKYGIPYPETEIVEGVDALEEFLKQNENVFVKFDIFRGDQETFGIDKSNEAVKLKIANLRNDFGPFADEIPFIVQKTLEGPEPGCDLIFNGKKYLEPCQYGYEAKGTGCYIGKIVPRFEDIPEVLREHMEKIIPFLRESDYRGAISSEGIVDRRDGVFKVIDWCCRFPYPLSAIYTENFENYSEIVEKVAKGEDVVIKIKYPYVGLVAFESEFANEHWLDINFDPDFRDRIKMRIGVYKNGVYYAVPGFSSVVTIVGLGNSVDEVIQNIKDVFEASGLSAFMLSKESIGGLEFCKKLIEEGKKVGIDF